MSTPVRAQTNVEDVRRAWYAQTNADPNRSGWWLREMFLNPNSVIVDDGAGNIFKQMFTIKQDQITFGEARAVKVKYVTAAQTGLAEPEAVAPGRQVQRWFKPPEQPAPKRASVRITVDADNSESDAADIEAKILIETAIGDGRIAPGRAKHYMQRMRHDPQGTRRLLNRLEPQPRVELSEHPYPTSWLREQQLR